MARRFDIVNGPSKWDLMLALFDTTTDLNPNRARIDGRVVFLEIGVDGKKYEGDTQITGVKKKDLCIENPEGNEFVIEGSCVFRHGPLADYFIEHHYFVGQYNVQTRKGWLETTK